MVGVGCGWEGGRAGRGEGRGADGRGRWGAVRMGGGRAGRRTRGEEEEGGGEGEEVVGKRGDIDGRVSEKKEDETHFPLNRAKQWPV